MKQIITILFLLLIMGLQSFAQKSYEMELTNVVQVNETEFTFDVRLRNTSDPVEPFAIEAIQWQLSFNTAMLNGGGIRNGFLTYVNGTSDLSGSRIIPISTNFTSNQTLLQWVTDPLGLDEETTLFDDNTWKRIGTFRLRLSIADNSTVLNNFADVPLNLEFVADQVYVIECPYYEDGGLYYRLNANSSVINSRTLTNAVDPLFELAGYYIGVGTDWATAANWNNTVANTHPAYHQLPGAANNALVGVAAEIATATKVVINNLYIKSSGSLRIKSDASGTGYLIHNNANVPATVERFLSQGKYHYVSSPVEMAPYSLFQVWPAPPYPAFADFYEWVETTREWINLNYNAPVGVLAPGQGYAVAYSDADYTKEFVGELNVGTVPFEATYTPGPVSPFWNQRGFNFVGNPYPAALDGDAFLNAHPEVFGLYFWDEAADYQGDRDDYATYSLAGGVGVAPGVGGTNPNAPTGIIAPSQGFILQVKSTPFNQNAVIPIAFENDMRVTDDSYFYKEQEDRDRIWLSVTGPQEDYNEILVAFMEGAEVGMDRTDAEKYKISSRLAFYSELEGGDFVIQGLPVLNQTDTYEIALGVDAGFAGNYTFDVQLIENFDPAAVITLEDRLANKFTNLRTTSQYVAQIAEPGEIRNRFFLHFNGATSVPVIDQKLTKVYALQNQIIIQHLGSSEILDVEVINTLGQLVTRTPVHATDATITVPGHNVVYIVKVRTTEGIESHKLLIR
ncbi:MAG: T9SS type A sorting domain-containing protein [Bacteroidales bacterium]|nr:T9SS type A sorting domain-containing protein [Bacteroidales bacterium]